MWKVIAAVVGVLTLTGCASASGNHDGRSPASPPPGPGPAVGAVAAALAFASHSDPEVGVVDGYAIVPLAVQRGEQPIALGGGQANPCAQPPPQRFTASERAAIRTALSGRTVRFVRDPAGWLAASSMTRQPTRSTQVLVTVQWDGHAWQATATGTGKR